MNYIYKSRIFKIHTYPGLLVILNELIFDDEHYLKGYKRGLAFWVPIYATIGSVCVRISVPLSILP